MWNYVENYQPDGAGRQVREDEDVRKHGVLLCLPGRLVAGRLGVVGVAFHGMQSSKLCLFDDVMGVKGPLGLMLHDL